MRFLVVCLWRVVGRVCKEWWFVVDMEGCSGLVDVRAVGSGGLVALVMVLFCGVVGVEIMGNWCGGMSVVIFIL